MTTEPPVPPEPTPAPEPTPRQPDTSSVTTAMSGETMVMVAGLIILGVYLVFGLIAEEWFPPDFSLIPGTFAVLLPRVGETPIGSGLTRATLMKLVGYIIAVAGLWDFVETIRFGWGGAADVIAWLLLAGAAALGFFGARSIQT